MLKSKIETCGFCYNMICHSTANKRIKFKSSTLWRQLQDEKIAIFVRQISLARKIQIPKKSSMRMFPVLLSRLHYAMNLLKISRMLKRI